VKQNLRNIKIPSRKVKHLIAVKPIQPVSIANVESMIATCKTKDFYDLRDKAFFLFLLDTGARAAETCAVNLEDIDLRNGSVLFKIGKGKKRRTVFLGKKSRRALRTYLKS
jgi:integrase